MLLSGIGSVVVVIVVSANNSNYSFYNTYIYNSMTVTVSWMIAVMCDIDVHYHSNKIDSNNNLK